ncbi:MAG: hypothetical protein V4485_01215, partial [Pseudomonadota bacterium]
MGNVIAGCSLYLPERFVTNEELARSLNNGS